MAVFIFPDVVPRKNQKGEGELGKNEWAKYSEREA